MTEVAGKGLGMHGHVNSRFLGPRVVNPHFGDVSKGWAWETRVMGVLPGVVHSSSTLSSRADVHMAFYVPSILRAGASPQGMNWPSIFVSSLGTVSIYLTWQGGETWLLFNNLSPFVSFTPAPSSLSEGSTGVRLKLISGDRSEVAVRV